VEGDDLLAEQVAYYRARAPEYDSWWERRAQYVLDADRQARWHAERVELETLVDGWLARASDGRMLELACGTGIWTQRLARHAREVLAVDAAPETIAIAREKVQHDAKVQFVEADVFSWKPATPSTFDIVFFSFWLSHVPPDRFEKFWDLVQRALAPQGTAILIDNKWNDGVWPPVDERTSDDFVQIRTDLSSGEPHRIVKVYYEPDELEQRLAALGWRADITSTDRFFVAGTATRH
jgi:demethylmenaquinone methyltransferase/2-methoxy-6-polyprenyl-1,4-benzoquinol methylase